MRKTLLVFTTMALALLLATGAAWAATGAPTATSTTPQTGVALDANITATFSEAMKARSINTNTFYLLPGHFTANPQATNNYAKNPPKRCYTTTGVLVEPCPAAIPATVSYAGNTATLNPFGTTSTRVLEPGTEYTAVVEGTGDGDYVAVKDTGGTAMYTDFIFYFTTASAGSGGGGSGQG
jgi:hypothetical protein